MLVLGENGCCEQRSERRRREACELHRSRRKERAVRGSSTVGHGAGAGEGTGVGPAGAGYRALSRNCATSSSVSSGR